jgi:hypothetical protein
MYVYTKLLWVSPVLSCETVADKHVLLKFRTSGRLKSQITAFNSYT